MSDSIPLPRLPRVAGADALALPDGDDDDGELELDQSSWDFDIKDTDFILGSSYSEQNGLLHGNRTAPRSTPRDHGSSVAWSSKNLSIFDQFCISCYWFGWSFLWMPALLVQVVPAQVENLVDESEKGRAFAFTSLAGSILGLFLAPLFGSMSDHSANVLGRRRPFMIIGTIISTIGLLVMAFSPPFPIYVTAFMVLSIGNTLTVTPYSALIPDIVSESQRGVVSGWLGAMSMLGAFMGGGACYFMDANNPTSITSVFIFLILVHALCATITIYFVVEERIHPFSPQFVFQDCLMSFVQPFKDHDFRWLFCSRLFIQMGVVVVEGYMRYFIQATITNYSLFGVYTLPDEDGRTEKAVSILFVPLIVGAFFSSLASGVISDYLGKRKVLVYVSGVIMASTCVIFSFSQSFSGDFIISLLFGIGFGIFSAIDWAIATDVLPSESDYGKDMGLWTIALVLPQVIGVPLAGFLLDLFTHSRMGFVLIFLLNAIYFTIGTYFIKFLRGVK